jgi:hypothetical protein
MLHFSSMIKMCSRIASNKMPQMHVVALQSHPFQLIPYKVNMLSNICESQT